MNLGFSRQEHWSGMPFPSQCMKVKSESEVAQSCPTLRNLMDCSPPGSAIRGIFQARVLEWGAIAISVIKMKPLKSRTMVTPKKNQECTGKDRKVLMNPVTQARSFYAPCHVGVDGYHDQVPGEGGWDLCLGRRGWWSELRLHLPAWKSVSSQSSLEKSGRGNIS